LVITENNTFHSFYIYSFIWTKFILFHKVKENYNTRQYPSAFTKSRKK
jgi:hypothetical protein